MIARRTRSALPISEGWKHRGILKLENHGGFAPGYSERITSVIYERHVKEVCLGHAYSTLPTSIDNFRIEVRSKDWPEVGFYSHMIIIHF